MKNPLTMAQQALLSAAVQQHPDAITAWQQWRDSIDWQDHLEHDEYALLPLIYRNLRRLKFEEPLLPRFKGVIRHSWLNNQRSIAELRETLTNCAHDQIELLILPPTQQLILDNSAVINWQQPLNWAVHPDQAEPAIRCLLRSGWHSAKVDIPHWSLGGYVSGTRHLLLQHDNQQLLMLSWGLEWWFDQRVAAVWQRAGHHQLAQLPVRCLDPTDGLEFELRQPMANNPFGRIANLLIFAATAQSFDWSRLSEDIRHRPLAVEWSTALTLLQPLLNQWGAPTNLHNWCTATPAPADQTDPQPAASRLKRFHTDWQSYRLTVGNRYTLVSSLIQLPGYLMGRWQLTHWTRLGRGLLSWIHPHSN